MMRRKLAILLMTALCGGQALACIAPAAPRAIPDGRTADKDVMLAKKKEIDRYRREVEEYLACEMNPFKIRTAQTDLERIANRFNEEVRAFKAANGG